MTLGVLSLKLGLCYVTWNAYYSYYVKGSRKRKGLTKFSSGVMGRNSPTTHLKVHQEIKIKFLCDYTL